MGNIPIRSLFVVKCFIMLNAILSKGQIPSKFATTSTMRMVTTSALAAVASAASEMDAREIPAAEAGFVPVIEHEGHKYDVKYTYRVVQELPHDDMAFTQGLTYHKGYLYESTGMYGQSELRKLEVDTGKVIQHARLPSNRFGEGMCIWKDRIIQLTWKAGEAYVWDLETLELMKTFRYTTENRNQAWGITHNNTHLIVSDGSHRLYLWDPETFEEVGRLSVKTSHGRKVDSINELEFVNGEILANIWFRHWIYRIDPLSGNVIGKIDFRDIYPESFQFSSDAVFNGIAVDTSTIPNDHSNAPLENVRLLVTGKLWPKLFDIRLQVKYEASGKN